MRRRHTRSRSRSQSHSPGRRRGFTIVTVLTAVTLTAVLATGCDPDDVDHSRGCVSGTSGSEVDKAVRQLDQAIEDYNKAVLNGDSDPDSSTIDAATARLKDVCAS
ncbi:hypothetical protein [Streptomyces sp. YU58]|uniref:hypothetical protein n=1 Tax=Streptomyces sp. SX92 TaxID=3158972 RepID=UPI0027B92D9A|nr:hypothetical protein [Streptomyces coralus]WLW52977.1 hypothetical protein QU709_17020 [Streptomyces coralus]